MLITLLETQQVSKHIKSLSGMQIHEVGFQTSYNYLHRYQTCIRATDHS